MGNKNTNLQIAKNVKDDEFYTTYETIEKEIKHYVAHFENKVVLCNCDDPYESNFSKFFINNFNNLKLKRLICTSFSLSKITGTQLTLEDTVDKKVADNYGFVLDITHIDEKKLSKNGIPHFLKEERKIKKLNGNGDFRSDECLTYLSECDIVVTNPPFSLFKEFVSEIIKHQKNFFNNWKSKCINV